MRASNMPQTCTNSKHAGLLCVWCECLVINDNPLIHLFYNQTSLCSKVQTKNTLTKTVFSHDHESVSLALFELIDGIGYNQHFDIDVIWNSTETMWYGLDWKHWK